MSRGKGSFVMITGEELKSPKYKQLSSSAKVVFVVAKFEAGKQNRPRKERRNYGIYDEIYKVDFVFPYKLINRYTNLSVPTISAALKDLLQSGFLIQTVNGGLRGVGGVPSRYQLSLEWKKVVPVVNQKETFPIDKDTELFQRIELSKYSGLKGVQSAECLEVPLQDCGVGTCI